MIKEKAAEIIKQLLKDEEEQGDIFFTDEDKTALKFAIKVLSAPTGDLISREALKDKCNELMKFNPTTDRILNLIDNAPTVSDRTEEVLSLQNTIAKLVEGIAENATPEGEWIKHIDDLFPEDSSEECPFCHEEQRLVGNDDNFCPNCGAKLKMPY